MEQTMRTLYIISLTAAFLLLTSTPAQTPGHIYKPPVKPVREQQVSRGMQGPTVIFEITAYTASDEGMNGKGITASGVRAREWHTVAASRSYPFGTRIHIPALNKTFVVQDRGGLIKGNKLDLFMESREEALNFGRRKLEGVILHETR